MNTDTLAEIQSRMQHLERQNRILIMLFCAIAGIASIAATNHAAPIITAAEVRTPHLTMVDNHGTTLAETQAIDGVVYIKKYANQVTN